MMRYNSHRMDQRHEEVISDADEGESVEDGKPKVEQVNESALMLMTDIQSQLDQITEDRKNGLKCQQLQSQNDRMKINLTNLQEQLQMRDQRMKELFKQMSSIEEDLRTEKEKARGEQVSREKQEKRVTYLEKKCKQLK